MMMMWFGYNVPSALRNITAKSTFIYIGHHFLKIVVLQPGVAFLFLLYLCLLNEVRYEGQPKTKHHFCGINTAFVRAMSVI